MARADKVAAVAEIAEEFRSSSAAVLTEYRGLTVAQLQELRRALGANANYAVVKNTLTKIAAKDAGHEELTELLVGPSAIAFVKGDPVLAAKGLRDFAKAHPMLVIKGGLLDGRPLSPDEFKKLADLESREVMLAKLAGAMKASLSGAASLFQAPLSQMARLAEALRQKAAEDPSILRGGTGTPAPAAETTSVEPAAEAGGAEAGSQGESADSDAGQTEPGDAKPAAEAATAESADSAESAESTEGASTEG
jgi:large subunit ribosomal protein L10